jgi:hypothetical protein
MIMKKAELVVSTVIVSFGGRPVAVGPAGGCLIGTGCARSRLTGTLLCRSRDAILDFGDTGAGAGLVPVAAGCAADAQRGNDFIAGFDRHAASERQDVRQG